MNITPSMISFVQSSSSKLTNIPKLLTLISPSLNRTVNSDLILYKVHTVCINIVCCIHVSLLFIDVSPF